MTKSELNDQYFDWLYQLVVDRRYSKQTYINLFERLYQTEFTYLIPMDGNRAEDGVELRYRFGHEQGYPEAMVASLLDDRPCSVLEMIMALASRMESQIMSDPDIGDRTGQWFWSMLTSLGIGSMNDFRFDSDWVDYAIRRFLNRDYYPNGEGGLFTISNPPRDMRNVEIWYQMNYYLHEFMNERSF